MRCRRSATSRINARAPTNSPIRTAATSLSSSLSSNRYPRLHQLFLPERGVTSLPPLQAGLRYGRPAYWKTAPEYDDEFYESEGAPDADGLDPLTFREECTTEAGDLVPMPNSPRVGSETATTTLTHGGHGPWRKPMSGSLLYAPGMELPGRHRFMDTIRQAEIYPRDPAPESTWRPQTGLIRRGFMSIGQLERLSAPVKPRNGPFWVFRHPARPPLLPCPCA